MEGFETHVVDSLIDDHRYILQALDVLEESVELLAQGRLPPSTVARLARFLEEFADGCHHAKEEAALFPCMEARGHPFREGGLKRLTCDHGVARYLLRGLLLELEKLERGEGSVERVKGYAARYVELIRRHIDYEDLEVLRRLEGLWRMERWLGRLGGSTGRPVGTG